MDDELTALAAELAGRLKQAGGSLATAESCTGGGLAQILTTIPGSSTWFERGFVSYSNLSKHEMLGVPADTLARHGAVSAAVAQAMAEGALDRSHAEIAVAITGIAGPGGGSADKPVGTVFIAWAGRQRRSEVRRQAFTGDRERIRRQSVAAALEGLLRYLANTLA
ncbi:MAG: CinA family protein [Gammaproteobacteria bacterium]|nr:CinA family protein [Gammaproteobacteria bacterium]